MKRLFLAFIIFVSACSHKGVNHYQGKIIIAVAVPSIGYFLEQIGAGRIKIVSLLKEGQHIENIDLSAKTIQKLMKADFYFSMNTPTEKSLRLESIIKPKKLISLNENSLKNKDVDPHFWMNPKSMITILEKALKHIQGVDRDFSDFYQKNFLKVKEKLNHQIKKLEKTTAHLSSSKFLIFHPFLGYFAKEYRLQQISLEKEGKEVTITQMKKVLDTIKTEHLQFIFVDKNTPQNVLDMLKKEYLLKVVEISPTAKNFCKEWDTIIDTFNQYGLKEI